jgi:chloramphenicol O-acetyltransferase type A
MESAAIYLPHSQEKKKLDLDHWPRREHFHFFNSFEEPYHGVCIQLDCTDAYRFAKQRGISFFLYCVYQTLSASQAIEAFRLRIEQDEVFLYNRIDAGSVVDRSDGTFGYGLFPYHEDLVRFLATAAQEMERIRNTTGLPRTTTNNLIRYSVLPWIDFTSLSHARAFSRPDSCPRITFGKMTEHNGRRAMPLSIHVNHALIDGRNLGQYLERLQELMNAP